MAGTLVADNITDGSANTGNTTDMIKGSARAWVNFNGTGTVAIRASYNVSSITDNGTGLYTVNFTNAMSDTGYSLSMCRTHYPNVAGGIFGEYTTSSTSPNNRTTSSCKVMTNAGASSSVQDDSSVSVAIFR